jgi:hypothetical protein
MPYILVILLHVATILHVYPTKAACEEARQELSRVADPRTTVCIRGS